MESGEPSSSDDWIYKWHFRPFPPQSNNIPSACLPSPLFVITGLFTAKLLLQVRCIEMKRADHTADSFEGPINQGADPTPLGNSLEIKDAYLPPWIVCNLCELVGSCGSFEARYVISNCPTQCQALTFSNKLVAAQIHSTNLHVELLRTLYLVVILQHDIINKSSFLCDTFIV